LEDFTMKLGLLMEAAQAQQAAIATTLERLREHTAGLDSVVREEIRATLVEELAALATDSRRAAQALRGLERVANLRVAAWGVAVTTLSAVVPMGIAWWVLPSHGQLAALVARRDELAGNIVRLTQQGGRLELRRCGPERRLCVRVDRRAPIYGEASDYLVVKGY
jgi:hypothetical protein